MSQKGINYQDSSLLTWLGYLLPLPGSFLSALSFVQNYVRDDM